MHQHRTHHAILMPFSFQGYKTHNQSAVPRCGAVCTGAVQDSPSLCPPCTGQCASEAPKSTGRCPLALVGFYLPAPLSSNEINCTQGEPWEHMTPNRPDQALTRVTGHSGAGSHQQFIS